MDTLDRAAEIAANMRHHKNAAEAHKAACKVYTDALRDVREVFRDMTGGCITREEMERQCDKLTHNLDSRAAEAMSRVKQAP